MNPAAVQDELNFWKSLVKTDRFKNNWCSELGLNPELDTSILNFILQQRSDNPLLKVIDLGSGVASILRNTVPGSQLVSCDPLANYYSQIFDYEANGIVKPLPYRTEDLPYAEEFDIVHIRNALDHSQDPLLAYKKMVEACKVGGYVIVSGFEDEGTAEGWSGFHQYNIRPVTYIESLSKGLDTTNAEKWLLVSKKDGISIPIKEKDAIIERRELPNGKWWFNWIVKK